MIPKTIHYCWFGGKKLPRDVKKCIKSWKKHCPDYQIVRWDETNFDINCCRFVKDAYESKAWAFVSDYARLKIIYENGGVYLDTDVELLKSLDGVLDNKAYFGIQQQAKLVASGLGFGAESGNIIVKKLLEIYEKIEFDQNKKLQISCPFLNTKVLSDYGFKYDECTDVYSLCEGEVTLYSSKYFDPIAPGDTINLLCKDTYSIHHYSASWTKYLIQLDKIE